MFSFIGSCIVIVGFAAWLNSVLWYKNITLIKDNKTFAALAGVFFFCAERPRLCDMHKAGCFLLCKAQKQGFFLVFLKLQLSLQRSCKDYSAILKSEKRKTNKNKKLDRKKRNERRKSHVTLRNSCCMSHSDNSYHIHSSLINNTIYNITNNTKRKEQMIW